MSILTVVNNWENLGTKKYLVNNIYLGQKQSIEDVNSFKEHDLFISTVKSWIFIILQ